MSSNGILGFARALVMFSSFVATVSITHAQVPEPLSYPDLPLLMNGYVYAMARQPDGGIVIGGDFTSVNGVHRRNIARLDPDGALDMAWNPSADSFVQAIAVDPVTNSVYAAGLFLNVGGESRKYIAKIAGDGAGQVDPDWKPTVSGSVNAIVIGSNGAVYIGGRFTEIDGLPRSKLAKLSVQGDAEVDANWTPSANFDVWSLAVDESRGALYVGGSFTAVSGQSRSRIAKLSLAGFGEVDTGWNPVANGNVGSLALDDEGAVYVAGDFSTIGGASRNGLARLSGTGTGHADLVWNPSPNGLVSALAFDSSGAVFAGGHFSAIGGQLRSGLAKLSRSGAGLADMSWHPDPNRPVYQLVVDAAGRLHAGGSFTIVDSVPRFGLVSFLPTGEVVGGVDLERPGFAHAVLAQRDGGMIVGGHFLKAGSKMRMNILRMDANGTLDEQWNASASSDVLALDEDASGSIYAGGIFSMAGGLPRRYVAKFSGGDDGAVDEDWNPSPDSAVFALAVDGDEIFVGGQYTSIGGLSRNRIAKLSIGGVGEVDALWNPSASNSVYALEFDESGAIFVGGSFSSIGGLSRSRIAKLDRSGSGSVDANWNPGVQGGDVLALATDGDGALFAGGEFSSMGGLPRQRVAKIATSGAGTVDSVWNPGADGFVYSLVLDPSDQSIYVGGSTGIAGKSIRRLSRQGAGAADPDWQVVTNEGVRSIALGAGNAIYAGGLFTNANGSARVGLAAFPRHAPVPTTTAITMMVPESSVSGQAYVVRMAVSAVTGVPVGMLAVEDDLGAGCDVIVSQDGEGECLLTSVSAGPRTLIASYVPADAREFSPSFATAEHIVERAGTDLTIVSHAPHPSTPILGVSVSIALAVVPPGAGEPTGSIFVGDGIDACSIPAGSESCELILTSRGQRTLTATYLGDDDFNPSGTQILHNVNRLPIITGGNYAGIEDASLMLAPAQGVLAGASDPDDDSLTIANTGTIAPTGIGGTVLLRADGSFDYTPPPDASGVATFEYVVSDGLEEVVATATITVEAVNDAPTFVLASVPAWPAGESGAKLQPGFASVAAFGPPDEAGQQVQGWSVRTISDPAGVASSVAISNDGTLSYTLSGNAGSATFGVTLQDDGGTANGGDDTSDEQLFTIMVAAGLDLSVAIDDDRDFAQGGGTVEYTIVVHNAGPNAAVDARVRSLLPFNLVEPVWACTPDAGASCTAEGVGGIDDSVTIPMGASLIYVLGATVLADPEAPIESSASVLAPDGVPDADGTNNSATDVDTVGIFADGFGGGDATLH